MNRIIGIVGNEGRKFTAETEEKARKLIQILLTGAQGMTSGGCHLGGIDIWAEEIADALGIPKIIHLPKYRRWDPDGYKDRNLRIVESCTELHNIVVAEYPPDYVGMRFDSCYHCPPSPSHIKSGGCWTMKQARRCGKKGVIHII